MANATCSANNFGFPWPSAWGTSGVLKIIADREFVSGGFPYPAGRASDPINQNFCYQAAISVVGDTGTFAAITLPQTDADDVQVVNGSGSPRYTAIIYSNGGNTKRQNLFQDWHLSSSLGLTFNFTAWTTDNNAPTAINPRSTWVDTDTLNRALLSVAYAPSSTTQSGIIKISETPADTSNPIAVGINDPRVAQFNAGNYVAELTTVPSPTSAPTVSTPSVTLGTFGTQPGNAAFTDTHRYQVAITYNGRTGESTIGPSVQFTAVEGQGLAVSPNAPAGTLAASANIYIKDLDGDNTWRRASDASGAVENNNAGFGDGNSAIGGMAVKYNPAGATPPGGSSATKPDGITALGETPSVAPTITKITSLLSTMGTLYFSYSWVTENGETDLSPISSGVTAPSAIIGSWMPLYVTETPPPGAVAIRVYAGTSQTIVAMKLQAENPIGWPRHPIHTFNSSGAAHVTSNPTSTLSTAQLAYNAAMANGGGLVVVPDVVETSVPLIFYGSVSGSNVFGVRITSHGTSNEGFNAGSGQMKINYVGSKADATCLLIATSTLEIDNIEFGDPNSKVKYGIVIADFEGGCGHQIKYNNITVRALESGGIGISSKTNNANAGSHASDTNIFTGKTCVFADAWAMDFSAGQTVGYQIQNLVPSIANGDSVANSGLIRHATTNFDYGLVLTSVSGHYMVYLTNEYLDPFATSNSQLVIGTVYNDGSDLRNYLYASPLDINGSVAVIRSVYESNGSAGQLYGLLLDNPARVIIDLLQMWGTNLYSYSNSVSGSAEFGITPLQFTAPNWGSRASTGYATPIRVLCDGAIGFRNEIGDLSTIHTNADGDIVLDPDSGVIASDQFESTISTGSPPLIVASTTKVTNLNSDTLDGQDWNSPTIATPIIASFTNAQHNHSNAAGGGQIAIGTGVSGLGANVAAFLGTPSSANLAAAVTGETGTNALVFGTKPTISLIVQPEGAALTISSNTIAPTDSIHQVGAGLIKTITVPSGFTSGTIALIPTAAFTYDATGNVLGTGTATIGRTMFATFSSSTSKWSMSY